MEVLEFIGGGLVLILVATIIFIRSLNVTIARWVAQIPAIAQSAVSDVKLPKFKLMDLLGYQAMKVLDNPEVQKAISGAVSGFLGKFGKAKGGLPPG